MSRTRTGLIPVATDADVRTATLAFRRRQSRLRYEEAARQADAALARREFTTDLDEWVRSMPPRRGDRA